jgi:DNA polymerase-3 subunit epsilon
MSPWFTKKKEVKPPEVHVTEDWNWDPNEGFVVIDLETTGLSPKGNRVLEIAMIQTSIDGEPLAHWSTLINPVGPVGATEIHGIKQSDVEGSPTFQSIADEIHRRLFGQALSAHNARFDLGFLRAEFLRLGWALPDIPTVCTLEVSKHYLRELPQRRLSDCAAAIGLPNANAHRASSDAATTTGLLNYFLRCEDSQGSPLALKTMAKTASGMSWTLTASSSTMTQGFRKKPARLMEPLDEKLLAALFDISADELIDSDQGSNAFEYTELLLEVLEDGAISEDESASLNDLAETYGLDTPQRDGIHRNLIAAVSVQAWKDGVLTQSERRHIKTVASMLGIDEATARQLTKEAEEQRQNALSLKSKDLPTTWDLGEPLHVGEAVVFTGCTDFDRFGLEKKATRRGLKVSGSVSRKTTMLVSDDTMQGNKAKAAQELGIRVVHPDIFKKLLTYVQPARISQPNQKVAQKMETLSCQVCGNDFERISVKGRKPSACPSCRT